jgi:hypothetical protein
MPAETSLRRRFASPSWLLLALLMFPLPWVQVQCLKKMSPGLPPPGNRANPLEVIYGLLPRWDGVTLLAQSGLQAVLGTCSANKEMDDPAKMEREAGAAMRPSRLMAAWPVLVLGGILAGVLLPVGRCRLLAVAGCAGAALLLLAAQVLIGFPLEAAMRKLFADELAKQAAGEAAANEGAIYLTYTYWFFLAVLGTGGALVLTGLEWRQNWRRGADAVSAAEPCESDSPGRSP